MLGEEKLAKKQAVCVCVWVDVCVYVGVKMCVGLCVYVCEFKY